MPVGTDSTNRRGDSRRIGNRRPAPTTPFKLVAPKSPLQVRSREPCLRHMSRRKRALSISRFVVGVLLVDGPLEQFRGANRGDPRTGKLKRVLRVRNIKRTPVRLGKRHVLGEVADFGPRIAVGAGTLRPKRQRRHPCTDPEHTHPKPGGHDGFDLSFHCAFHDFGLIIQFRGLKPRLATRRTIRDANAGMEIEARGGSLEQ